MKLAQAGPEKARASARRTLSRWQRDPDLAGLREPDSLNQLPQENQRAWRKLWEDVAAQLKER